MYPHSTFKPSDEWSMGFLVEHDGPDFEWQTLETDAERMLDRESPSLGQAFSSPRFGVRWMPR